MPRIAKGLRCLIEGCLKDPCYGYPGGPPITCSAHKEPDFERVASRRYCAGQEGCKKSPSFAYPGTPTPTHCGAHQLPGMVNVLQKLCEVDGCEKYATYGYDEKKKKALRCTLHKLEGMIRREKPRCGIDDCQKWPAFGWKGKKAEYCKLHSMEGMVNVAVRTCKVTGCDKGARYKWPGDEKFTRCKDHAEPGMHCQPKKPKLCREEGCTKTCGYGWPDGPRLTCKAHMEPGMVPRASKICEVENCELRAIRGSDGAYRYCSSHNNQKDKNTNTIRPPPQKPSKCVTKGCEDIARFGWPNRNRPLHCEEHKQPGMMPAQHKGCQVADCHRAAHYGWPKEVPPIAIFCSKHILPGMTRINIPCAVEGCVTSAHYGYPGGVRSHCKMHALEGMIGMGHKRCCVEGCGKCVMPGKGQTMCSKHAKQTRIEGGVEGGELVVAPPRKRKAAEKQVTGREGEGSGQLKNKKKLPTLLPGPASNHLHHVPPVPHFNTPPAHFQMPPRLSVAEVSIHGGTHWMDLPILPPLDGIADVSAFRMTAGNGQELNGTTPVASSSSSGMTAGMILEPGPQRLSKKSKKAKAAQSPAFQEIVLRIPITGTPPTSANGLWLTPPGAIAPLRMYSGLPAGTVPLPGGTAAMPAGMTPLPADTPPLPAGTAPMTAGTSSLPPGTAPLPDGTSAHPGLTLSAAGSMPGQQGVQPPPAGSGPQAGVAVAPASAGQVEPGTSERPPRRPRGPVDMTPAKAKQAQRTAALVRFLSWADLAEYALPLIEAWADVNELEDMRIEDISDLGVPLDAAQQLKEALPKWRAMQA